MQNINSKITRRPNKLVLISLVLSIAFIAIIWMLPDIVFLIMYFIIYLPTTLLLSDAIFSIQYQVMPALWDAPSFSTVELLVGFHSILALIICGVIIFAAQSKKDNIKRSTALILFAMPVFCCMNFWVVYAGANPQSPRWKPAIQDVEGTYYPTNGSFDDSSELWTRLENKKVSSEYPMTLYANGTFSAINAPVWNRNYMRYEYGKAEGTWKFEKDTYNGEWDIGLHITKVDDTDMEYYLNINLSGKKPPYILCFQIGELEWLTYEKH